MQRIKLLLLLLCTPILLLQFTNCTSDDGNPLSSDESALVGTWDLTSVDITYQGETVTETPENIGVVMVAIFEADHSWDLTQTITSTETDYNSHGSWSLSGSSLILNAVGTDPTLTLSYSATNNRLILEISETVEGEIFTYEYMFTKR